MPGDWPACHGIRMPGMLVWSSGFFGFGVGFGAGLDAGFVAFSVARGVGTGVEASC